MNCRGMALLTGLLLMAAISLLAVTAAGGMTLQRHQAANYGDKERAATMADLARLHARAWLFSRADTERQAGCIQNCLLPAGILESGTVPERAPFETETWWRANAIEAGSHPVSGQPAGFATTEGREAFWLLEEIHFEATTVTGTGSAADGVGYYRILARGRGMHTRSITVSESIVARPWGGDFEPAAYPPESDPGVFCAQFDVTVPCGSLAWRELR